ncbi:hypothetical protein H5410_012687 [Solanum commersonii]|uniref:Uncharacterized protein n=1 Tax=Solanum commersonii TaxID=4109 RepID=A0A9J6ASB4_SOLCO|nr:hypothetical protein H5410_012687 [Solanum commersonii]
MTKESHEKCSLCTNAAPHGAKMAHKKLYGSMEKLQATLVDVEKDLKALTYKKKVIKAINKYLEAVQKSRECHHYLGLDLYH